MGAPFWAGFASTVLSGASCAPSPVPYAFGWGVCSCACVLRGSALWERVVRDVLMPVSGRTRQRCAVLPTPLVFAAPCALPSPLIKSAWLRSWKTAAVLRWEPRCWRDSRSLLQLRAAPVVWLFPVLNVVFSKNNLWALAEQVTTVPGVSCPIEKTSVAAESNLGLCQSVCWLGSLMPTPCTLFLCLCEHPGEISWSQVEGFYFCCVWSPLRCSCTLMRGRQGRLTVTSLSCLPSASVSRAFETQMTRLEAEFVRREAPPSYGQLIAQGLIPPVEDFPVYNASQVRRHQCQWPDPQPNRCELDRINLQLYSCSSCANYMEVI